MVVRKNDCFICRFSPAFWPVCSGCENAEKRKIKLIIFYYEATNNLSDFFAGLFMENTASAQDSIPEASSNSGWFSLGGRSTLSLFDSDGGGLGTSGQFRIRLSSRVNTDWFANYITINVEDKVSSEYYHIGWSVLYYPFEKFQYPKLLQPYILAGNYFDYNKRRGCL